MAKRIILYNLAEHMTDEKFKEYVTSDKGPAYQQPTFGKKV